MPLDVYILNITVQFGIWSEAQGAACGLSYSGITFVGGYPPPPIRGVEKLDLPRSYVPRAVSTHPLLYPCARHPNAVLYLVGSTGCIPGAELFRDFFRWGPAPL